MRSALLIALLLGAPLMTRAEPLPAAEDLAEAEPIQRWERSDPGEREDSREPLPTPGDLPDTDRVVAVSLIAWPATVPLMLGVSFTEVDTTVVVASVTGAATPSSTLMVNVVVSVLPGVTRLSVGSNTNPWIAVVAAAAVPLKV